jgi:hypothetical protein
MPSRLLSAFLVLILPLAVVLLVRSVALIALPQVLTADMRVACFVRAIKTPVRLDENIGRARTVTECDDLPRAPEAKEPASAPQTDTLAQQTTKQAASSPTARPETPTQFRAIEAKTRAAFGIASALLQAVAFGAFLFAFSQLVQNWRRAPSAAAGGANSQAAFQTCRRVIVATSLVVLAFAVWQAFADVKSDDFDNVLINLIVAAGEKAGTLRAGTHDTYRLLMTMNLIAAYLAAGLLLIYLATLAIPFGEPATMKERFAGFQFVIAIGATVLAVMVYANQKAVDLATLAIDPSTGASLIEAARIVLDFWSVICIAFLFTAIVAGYFGIRASRASASEPQADSALALRTPSGDDLKTLGWIVQLIIALAPAWMPAALKTIFEQLGKAPF